MKELTLVRPQFKTLKNSTVRFWIDKDGHPYKVEIRSDDWMCYFDPPKTIKDSQWI